MKKYEKNEELSSEEIVKKTFHVFDRFYEHLTSYPQCVTTEDIEDMKWVLDRIIPAIKEEQMLDRTFAERNKWEQGYSHLIIFGANRKEIIEKGKTLEGWEDKFFNCHYLDDEVGMSLDVCQMLPQEAADFFCEISQDVYVYAYWSLDESQFVVRCQGEDYYDLNAEIVKKCIFDNEKIRITDNKTGYQFFIGEKASTNEELHRYRGIVLNYKNTIG